MESLVTHTPIAATDHLFWSREFWEGKRVFITGHTGFKGAWLALWLERLRARITGASLPPSTTPNLFSLARVESCVDSHICDIRDGAAISKLIRRAEPEIVFHLAAQPLVRAGYREPLDTFATNVMGTANVLEALRDATSVRVAVAITTDKVYGDHEHGYPYRETDELGGRDPYSASKAASEIVIGCYRSAYLSDKGVAVASARAGNVIGGGDWSEDRLLPDAIRAWTNGRCLEVRRPSAIRPWQHVLEPLAGYLVLATKLWADRSLAGAYNFGPHTHSAATVREVIDVARTAFGSGEVHWGTGSEGPHESAWLALEVAKARRVLGVRPRWGLQESVTRTIDWYRRQAAGEDAIALCDADIAGYCAMP